MKRKSLPRLLQTKWWFVLAFTLILLSGDLMAAHYRYGNITWSRTNDEATNRTVTIKVNQCWSKSGFSSVTLGGTVEVGFNLNFGDGESVPIVIKVTSVNSTDDWFYGTFSVSHTYAGTATSFTALYFTSARLAGALQNNRIKNFACKTLIKLESGNTGSPVSSMPAIINLPTNESAATFTIPAADPDNQSLTFSSPVSSDLSTGSNNWAQASGFSVSTTGTGTFNTVNKAVGNLYNIGIKITDASGTTILLDFLVLIVQANSPPSINYSVTPSDGAEFSVSPGQTLSFSLEASATNEEDSVVLSAVGLPTSGVSFSPSLPTMDTGSVSADFEFTPTSSELGVYVVTFTAMSQGGASTNTSVTIIVNYAPQFIKPTKSESVTYVLHTRRQFYDTIVAENPDTSIYTRILSASIPSTATLLTSLPTSFSKTASVIMSWIPNPTEFGPNNITFIAEDENGKKVTRKYFLVANTNPSFTSIPDTLGHENALYEYNIVMIDSNLAHGDELEIELHHELPDWLTLTDNGDGTGTISGTPGPEETGTFSIELMAADIYHHAKPVNGHSHKPVEQEFEINVAPCNVSLNISHSNTTCPNGHDGSASVTYSSNGTEWDVLWSNNSTTDDIASLDPGTYMVTVTDNFGCSASDEVVIASESDNLKPEVVTKNITVYLDGSGNTSITKEQIENGSSDHCGIASYSLDKTGFDCGNLGNNVVTLTVTDVNNNSNTGTANVTVKDMISPTVVTQNVIVYLDVDGRASISPSAIDNGSTDNCSIASYTLNKAEFDCSNLGENIVILRVTDHSGNYKEGNATVTIKDIGKPTISCRENQNKSTNNGNCTYTVSGTEFDPTSFDDNCSGSSVLNDFNNSSSLSGAIFPQGTTTVVWTVTDASDNKITCSNTVTVKDEEVPKITCAQNQTQTVDAGDCKATVSVTTPTVSDNCGIATLINNYNHSSNASGLFPLGTTNIEWTVTDIYNNTSTCTQNIIVNDLITINPDVKDVSCFGDNDGAIDIEVGGSAPFTYSWNNSEITKDISNLVAGDYILTVKNNCGSEKTLTLTVTQPDPPTCDISGSSNVLGGLVSTYSGPSGLSYAWSVSGSGTHVCDGQCHHKNGHKCGTGCDHNGQSCNNNCHHNNSHSCDNNHKGDHHCSKDCHHHNGHHCNGNCNHNGQSCKSECHHHKDHHCNHKHSSSDYHSSGVHVCDVQCHHKSGHNCGNGCDHKDRSCNSDCHHHNNHSCANKHTGDHHCSKSCHHHNDHNCSGNCNHHGQSCKSDCHHHNNHRCNHSHCGNAVITGSSTSASVNILNPCCAGNYTVTLTTTDGNGCSNTCTKEVTVSSSATFTVYSSLYTTGNGHHPKVTKSVMASELKVYNRNKAGRRDGKQSHYSSTWNSTNNLITDAIISAPTTVSVGGGLAYRYIITVPAYGHYLVIGKSVISSSQCSGGNCTIYTGRKVGGHDEVDGDCHDYDDDDDDELTPCSNIKLRYHAVIKDQKGKCSEGNTHEEYGSLMMVISPMALEFTDTVSYLPIVYESVIGEWSVSASAEPPEGFYTEPATELSTEVTDSVMNAIQFAVIDTGSVWSFTTVKHNIGHNGEQRVAYSKPIMINNRTNKPGKINVYPNPALDVIKVAMPGFEGKARLCVYNQFGQKVYEQPINLIGGAMASVNIVSLAEGIYYVSASNSYGIASNRFIKLNK